MKKFLKAFGITWTVLLIGLAVIGGFMYLVFQVSDYVADYLNSPLAGLAVTIVSLITFVSFIGALAESGKKE